MATSFDKTSEGRFVVFQLENGRYALPIESVQEIIPAAEVSRPPSTPDFVRGILDVGGQLVTVVSLRRLWGLRDRTPDLYTPLIRLKSTLCSAAIEVDNVQCIATLRGAHASIIGERHASNDCAVAIVRHDGDAILVLAPERILLLEEERRLAELAREEQRRLAALSGESA